MRLLIQRVSRASVSVDGAQIAAIDKGLLVLAGFGASDPPDLPQSKKWRTMLGKIGDLRIFPDEAGKMNLSLAEYGGRVLVVSQFTLYADCKKGRRPSFHLAAGGDNALNLYNALVDDLSRIMPDRVGQGAFGREMDVDLVNWGPVTIWLDSDAF